MHPGDRRTVYLRIAGVRVVRAVAIEASCLGLRAESGATPCARIASGSSYARLTQSPSVVMVDGDPTPAPAQ